MGGHCAVLEALRAAPDACPPPRAGVSGTNKGHEEAYGSRLGQTDRLLPRRAERPEPPDSGSSEIGGGDNETSRKGCSGAVKGAPRGLGGAAIAPHQPPDLCAPLSGSRRATRGRGASGMERRPTEGAHPDSCRWGQSGRHAPPCRLGPEHGAGIARASRSGVGSCAPLTKSRPACLPWRASGYSVIMCWVNEPQRKSPSEFHY